MDIRNPAGLRRAAAAALADNPGKPRQMLLVYLAVTVGCSLLSTLTTVLLDTRIAQTGGLGGMSLRTTLSTIQQVVPLVLSIAIMGLELGYQGASLEMARRRGVNPRTLLMGFSRFGAMLRAMFCQGLLYLLLMILAVNVGSILFMFTPLARSFYELILPMATDTEALYNAMYNDPEFLQQVFNTMRPVFPIVGVLFLIGAAPVFYRFRMTNYCLLDNPRMGALAAMAESARMTRGARFALFRVDLGFWWFYLGQLLCVAAVYGGVIATLLDIPLPWNDTTAGYVFYGISLALEFILYALALNRVQTTLATAYDTLRPQPTRGGAVLGNIFDLAKEYRED